MSFKQSIKSQLGKSDFTAYPCILVVGASGTGKTRSITSLPPESTAILNIEHKPLTFPNADAFKESNIEMFHESSQELIKQWEDVLNKALVEASIKYIVIDSFTKYTEILLDLAKNIQKGYDIYNFYNLKIFKFLEKIKLNNKKFVIVLGIDELVDIINPNGSKTHTRRLAVRGKEWEGKLEKEFSIVAFTEIKQPDKAIDKPSYHFLTYSDSTTSTKTPEGMFKEKYIANDLKMVCDVAEKYFKLV